jgi:hypothetical protein
MTFGGRLGSPRSRLANIAPAHLEATADQWTETARALTWQEVARMPTFIESARPNTWGTPMTTLVKRAGETRLYTMDLSQLPEIAGGDTVSSVGTVGVSVVGPVGASADLTISSKAVASGNKGAQFKIAGGTDGATYLISVTVTTTAGYTLVGIGYLYVDDR